MCLSKQRLVQPINKNSKINIQAISRDLGSPKNEYFYSNKVKTSSSFLFCLRIAESEIGASTVKEQRKISSSLGKEEAELLLASDFTENIMQ